MCHQSEVFIKEKGENAPVEQTGGNYTGFPEVSKPFDRSIVGWLPLAMRKVRETRTVFPGSVYA